MSNRATLKCSSGRFWNIELRPAIGSVYLQDGWQQFLQDNSLGDREFLLFRYDGNMCFNVQIFEKSGCERLDMSVNEKDKESAVPEVKRKRGRPRKNPLVPSPLNSSGDSPGMQLKYFFCTQKRGICTCMYIHNPCKSKVIWRRENRHLSHITFIQYIGSSDTHTFIRIINVKSHFSMFYI